MKFEYQFDPLSDDPNNVEITADGVPFLQTSTIKNAEMVCITLNKHNELVDALKGLLEVCSCTNGCDPDDETCATMVARKILKSIKRYK